MHFVTHKLTENQQTIIEWSDRISNRCTVFRLEGALDEKRLHEAVCHVVQRCPSFSYRVLRVDDSQRIFQSDSTEVGLETIDVGDSQDTAHALIDTLRNRLFRLDGGAPYLFCLLRGCKESHLVFVCHPAIVDRFSLKPLFKAISAAYRGETLPENLSLPQQLLLDSEKALMESDYYDESMRFWLQLTQKASFEWRPARVESDVADTYFHVALPEKESAALGEVATKLGIGLNQLLLFSFHLFLFRVTRSEMILTRNCHRIRTGLPDQIGYNENPLVFKSLLTDGQTVSGFLRQAARLYAQALYNSDLPTREIILELKRKYPDYRLSNVLFDEDVQPYRELQLKGVTVTLLPSISHQIQIEDIGIYFDIQDTISFHALTRSPQDTSSLRMAFDHYLAMLHHLPEDIDLPVENIRLFTAPLHQKALALADGGALLAPVADVLTLFTDVCARTPDAPALRFNETTLSYAELSCCAGSVAAHLASHVGDTAEVLIGMCLSRSERMIQTIFGVLAAKAGYVPLDPQMPAERLRFIAGDAKLAAVIADATTYDLIASVVDCPVLNIDDLLDHPVPITPPANPTAIAHQTAYIIYTSGTTGKPKGVVIERGMLAHFIASLEGVWDCGPDCRWTQFASINFDASVLEIFNSLSHGSELVVVPSELRGDPETIFTLMNVRRITHAFLPPALLRLLPRRPLPDLRAIVCGGEAGDEDTVRFWSKAVDLANGYGPTEATVMATINRMGGYKAANNLGRPLHGYQVYLLDANEELAPLGGIGEIVIGSPSVAREYLGRPELNIEKFRPNPFGPGRIYHTGDLGRFLPSGELEFLGRSDFQVKIRGFRMELGDIENAITEQPEVRGVYVGAFEQAGGKQLLAWYTGTGLKPDTLRKRLEQRLQHYMIPSFLIPIDSFPLNISGKIDRTRLPMPTYDDDATVSAVPLDELEMQVRDIWAGVLNVAATSLGPGSHFFHLGGHSLLAALVCSKLSAALSNTFRPKQLFEHPVLADFCDKVRGTAPEKNPLPPLTATGQTSAMVANRFIDMMYSRTLGQPGDNTYNIVVRIDFSREINPLTLRSAYHELLTANPVFRAAFAEQQSRLWLRASEEALPPIPLVDTSSDGISARAQALLNEPLGMTCSPLCRAEIHCTADGKTSLIFCIHHALFDGWSLNLFLEELAARYEGRTVPTRLTWFDYWSWAPCLPGSQVFADSITYWKKKLAGVDAHTDLPADSRQKRPDANAFIHLRIEPQTVADLKAFADSQNITLSPLFMALYIAWIWRLTGQEEIVCSYPYAGRDIPGTEEIYGAFVTVGYLRQTVQPRSSFNDLALAVHRQMLDDKEHLIATPLDAEIAGLESLNLIFSLQSGIGLEGSFGGATYQADEFPSKTSKTDLAGIFYQCADGAIEGRVEYDSSLFRSETIAGFLDNFKTIIDAVARQPETRINELTYQSDATLARFMALSCGPRLDQHNASIPERFNEVVQLHPERLALIFNERRHTFLELADWTDRIAAGLAKYVIPGERIGLSMQKSDGLIATVLAILKLGCAYIPLDPSYPPDRVRFFVENSAVRHVAADAESHTALCAIGLDHLDFIDPLAEAVAATTALPPVAPNTLAYIIHTSGSTGQPKGVMIEHANVVRLALASADAFELSDDSISSLIASMNFDASVVEIFPCLLGGHTLAVIPEADRKDPIALHRTLTKIGVTHALFSPVVLQNLPREEIPSLRMLGFGGDVLDERTADWWSRRTRLLSLYGPTEITVMSSHGQVLPDANPRIIGKPLAGYRMYLLNRFKQPVPLGAVGEICIGGDNLARGYLNRDDLTIERFVIDPFDPSPYALMYLTGDLGRFLPDGTIEFFGRNDAQIKLRGFRIELGEIEASIGTFPGLKHVVCAAKGEGENRYLAAYYLADQELDDEALRQHASQFLPDYMVPSFFVRLDALPAGPSGKIDRKALPTVAGKISANPPHDGLERQIADIWEQILRYRGIGRDDSFFHVGGNSLLAVRMQAEVYKQLGISFTMAEFYGASTIEALAAGKSVNHIQQAISDARAELVIANPAPAPAEVAELRQVLLTGARGFLGSFLLNELTRRCETVYCLLRCRDEADGLESLRKQAKEAGITPDFDRVRILPGDLAEPGLGLSDDIHQRLAEQIDAIVHCGAFVHHLHNYATMKAANVDATIELLKLALAKRRKTFCFVSTLSVATAIEGATRADEAILPNPPVVDNGYLLTKWVGEQLVAQCARHYGLPTVIARAGNITGCSANGFSNYANNHFWLFNQGCLQLGSYPDIANTVEMTPVDLLARAIAGLALTPRTEMLVANLSNPNELSLHDFFRALAKCDCSARPEPAAEWQKRLASLAADNGLTQIKEFYTGDLSGEAPPTEQTATLAALADLGINYAADYNTLIPLYVDYLKRQGFLP
ncbi:MAG: amino acid adenylation domain-containing protein [Desulfobulbus sp.]|nr:amino acid adenylation domain-containing protein [Desulfobulbus sp.]